MLVVRAVDGVGVARYPQPFIGEGQHASGQPSNSKTNDEAPNSTEGDKSRKKKSQRVINNSLLIVSSELEQRRSLFPQTLQIDDLVVRGASVPALPDDPNPFKGQSADGGVMVFAFGALTGVVSAGPEGVLDRLRRELMKVRAEELGTELAATDAAMFAAALDARSNAGEAQQFISTGPTAAV